MNMEMIEELKEETKKIFKKQKHYIPTVFLEGRDGNIEICALTFRNDYEKEAMSQLIKIKLRSGKYKSYLFITDGYIVMTQNPEECNNIRPSEHPDRKEGLVFNYQDDVGKVISITIPYIRYKKSIKFCEENRMEDFGIFGRMVFWE